MVSHRLRVAAILLLSTLPAGAAAQADEAPEERGWIGIQIEGGSLPDGSLRVMIVRVEPGSPARRRRYAAWATASVRERRFSLWCFAKTGNTACA